MQTSQFYNRQSFTNYKVFVIVIIEKISKGINFTNVYLSPTDIYQEIK